MRHSTPNVCRSFSPTQPRAKCQRLASPRELNRLNTNSMVVLASTACTPPLLSPLTLPLPLKMCQPTHHGSPSKACKPPFLSPLSSLSYLSSASGAWPARTQPGMAGLLPVWPASDITPINRPSGGDSACCQPLKVGLSARLLWF